MAEFLKSITTDWIQANTVPDALARAAVTSQLGVTLAPVVAAGFPAVSGVVGSQALTHQRVEQHGENQLRDLLAHIGFAEVGSAIKNTDWYRDAYRTDMATMRGYGNRMRTKDVIEADMIKHQDKFNTKRHKGKVVRVDRITPSPTRVSLTNNYAPKPIVRLPLQETIANRSRAGYYKNAPMIEKAGPKVVEKIDDALKGTEQFVRRLGGSIRPSGSPTRNVAAGLNYAGKQIAGIPSAARTNPKTVSKLRRLTPTKVGKDIVENIYRGGKGGVSIGKVGKAIGGAGVGLGRGLVQFGRNLGTGVITGAAGTAAGNVVLTELADRGFYDALGIDKEDAQRHTEDFVMTEIGGYEVPNLDPISSVLKTTGKIGELHDVNVERGHHEDGVLDTSGFIYDQISQAGEDFTVNPDFGDNPVADAVELGAKGVIEGGAAIGGQVLGGVGATANAITGGIAAGGKTTYDFVASLNPWG